MRPPSAIAAGFARVAHLIRGRDCDSEICQLSDYLYGVGPNLLWSHANLDAATHEWVGREFGFSPISFFKQIGRSQRKGYLQPVKGFVPVNGVRGLPEDLLAEKPLTDAFWTFLAGAENRIFLPSSQRKSFEHFESHRPENNVFHELPGLTHLDVFFSRQSAVEAFPKMVEGLERATFRPAEGGATADA